MPPSDHEAPCATAIRLEARMDSAEDALDTHGQRIHSLETFQLSAVGSLATINAKMFFMGAMGSLVGGGIATVVAALIIYKITGR